MWTMIECFMYWPIKQWIDGDRTSSVRSYFDGQVINEMINLLKAMTIEIAIYRFLSKWNLTKLHSQLE